MRFLTIFRAVEREAPPSQGEIEAMGKLIQEMAEAHVLTTTEGCKPSRHGARVRRAGGQLVASDGPFTEAKEVIGGFAILEVASKEEAIAWTKRFMDVGGDGECEIHELYEVPAFVAS